MKFKKKGIALILIVIALAWLVYNIIYKKENLTNTIISMSLLILSMMITLVENKKK